MDSISNFPPPRQQNLDGLNLDSKVSPSILIIIIILAIIFFICGLLHLLVRFLLRPQAREQDEMSRVTALQGQLQQLFHLHDAGLDQFFIDSTLPVFQYLDIIGSKNSKNNNINNDPFDCSVCLCEFEPEDKLRLLPKCSHAFHMECIDTWLLSHSTCPLCRASLVPDLTSQSGSNHVCSPVVFVLESGREQQSREISELGSSRVEVPTDSGEEVVAVKLGKFRNVDDPDAEGSNSNEVTRRCYSMGHFEYVMDEDSLLKVPIRAIPAAKKPCNLPLTPGQRSAMSECDCESRREFNGFEGFASLEENSRGVAGIGDANGRSKRRESYSVSKIWLRGKKEMQQSLTEGGCGGSSSRRAFSFRFPMSSSTNLSNGNGGTRRSNSETGIGSGSARLESGPTNPANAWTWENGQELASEYCFDEESGPGVDFQAKTPSFARRTLLWLVGRQSKVGNSQFTNDDF